ncbi:amidohydrolase 3, partial [Dendrothele bispora CBS 962.96]
VQLVKEYILSNPDVYQNKFQDIYGWGFDKTRWPEEKWPTLEALDADPITKDRPIRLTSKDGHAIWTSKTVIDANAPFPNTVEGGIIVQDKDGNPTGIFLDSAQEFIETATPDEVYEQRIAFTVEDALKNGITAMHDAGFLPNTLEFYKRRTKKYGDLPIGIYAMHSFRDSVSYLGNSTEKLDHDRLRMRSVKLICDGDKSWDGYFWSPRVYGPYSDDPTNFEFMRLSAELLNEVVPRFLKDGGQVNAQAIGDRANGIVLDAFEKAVEEGIDIKSLRPRIEQAQIMTEEDLERIGRLGVIASIQPTHATDDMWYGEQRLGPKRVRSLYAFRKMIESGARITLGSDIPVDSINPLEGFYAAITRRRSPHGPGGWFPDQKLTRIEALRGMTIDPAYASFSEDMFGSLEPGKKADYVVLSKDIMKIEPREILGVEVLATVMDGKVVYVQL